jgi:hypothetical protein
MKNDQLFLTLERAPEMDKPYFADAFSFLVLLANGGQAPAPGALSGWNPLKKLKLKKRMFKVSGKKSLISQVTKAASGIVKGAGGMFKGFGGGNGGAEEGGEPDADEMEGQGMHMPSSTFAGFDPSKLSSMMSPDGLHKAKSLFSGKGAGTFLMKNKGKLFKMSKSKDGAEKVEAFDPSQAPKTYADLKEGAPVPAPEPTGPMPFSANVGGSQSPTPDDMHPSPEADGGEIRPTSDLLEPSDTVPVPVASLETQAIQAQGLEPSDSVKALLSQSEPTAQEEALEGIFARARNYSLGRYQ